MTGLVGYLAVALGVWFLIRWRAGVTLGNRAVVGGEWRRVSWQDNGRMAGAALLWPLTILWWLARGRTSPRSSDRTPSSP